MNRRHFNRIRIASPFTIFLLFNFKNEIEHNVPASGPTVVIDICRVETILTIDSIYDFPFVIKVIVENPIRPYINLMFNRIIFQTVCNDKRQKQENFNIY